MTCDPIGQGLQGQLGPCLLRSPTDSSERVCGGREVHTVTHNRQGTGSGHTEACAEDAGTVPQSSVCSTR